jgi:hypothetical protein
MLRETIFLIGGVLVIGLGIALAAGLLWARAGWWYVGPWTGVPVAVGLGSFFIYVSREEGAERRRFLAGYGPEARPPS